MLNIIICENNKNYKLKTFDIINKYMMNTNIKYKIKTFESYTSILKKFIESSNDSHNIYFLDIQLNDDDSGIDIANDIRKKDYDSIIILETGYKELISEAQRLRLSILDYVCKKVNYDKNIIELLELSLKIFNLKNSLKFQIDKIDYNIKYENIIKIESNSDERKCIITTIDNKYDVKKPLYFLEKQLNSNFHKINRGCIINIQNIKQCDYTNNIINFCNGDKLVGMISIKSMKGLKEHVRNS